MVTGSVQQLAPDSRGRWLIHTRGSIHVLDLDAGTYERRPGPTSRRFAHDNTTLVLTRVEIWPQVGARVLVWVDDPDLPELLEFWRLTSTINRIARDGDDDPPPEHVGRLS
jgi:hypothetical protein